MNRKQLSENSWIDRGKIKPTLSLTELWKICPVEHGTVMMYGKEIEVPRFQKSYGKSYYFSGLTHEADPIPQILEPLLEWVNTLNYGTFNQILLNFYENGLHYINLHSDDTSQLVQNSPIVSISLGATRTFRIRPINDKTFIDYHLSSGDMVIMGGQMQKEFKHEIVKISGEKGKKIGKRINITFRQFK